MVAGTRNVAVKCWEMAGLWLYVEGWKMEYKGKESNTQDFCLDNGKNRVCIHWSWEACRRSRFGEEGDQVLSVEHVMLNLPITHLLQYMAHTVGAIPVSLGLTISVVCRPDLQNASLSISLPLGFLFLYAWEARNTGGLTSRSQQLVTGSSWCISTPSSLALPTMKLGHDNSY